MKQVQFASTIHKPRDVTGVTQCHVGMLYVQVTSCTGIWNKEILQGYHFFDQLVEHYPLWGISYRSWMYIFYWLMNAAIVNSVIQDARC